MKYTPEKVIKLLENQVFVFGSNEKGIHGAGAAKTAYEKFGAEWGVGEGVSGSSYAFPTKDGNLKTRSLKDIEYSVVGFLSVCNSNPDQEFLMTLIGCGLAGFALTDIASLFRKYKPFPKNIIWPKEFADIIFYNT